MFTSAVRRASRPVTKPLRRSVSSQLHFSNTAPTPSSEESTPAPPESSRQSYLTLERKRQLISLYHSTEKFVTLDNLSDYIDKEFELNAHQQRMKDDKQLNRAELSTEIWHRQAQPKMIARSENETDNESASFGGRLSKIDSALAKKHKMRNQRLRAAMYGVDDSLKASLEMVEEYRRSGSVDITNSK
ncbi:hypothetical protein DFH11DRAFT_1857154 [Phellopilus nigrolimitatus]|nr:hypothetical protein DFH11DRAFT_1857154 [Phellopilus nigrolimitatus]